MESPELPIKLFVPNPSQAQLSFCSGTVESMSKWVKSLPMANTGESSRLLYQAIRELNQWETDPLLRLKLLEVLRPYIYNISQQLNKHFLLSSISLNDKQLKIANLSQALHSHLAMGYKLVVAQSISSPSARASMSINALALAIHRAISDSAQIILRALQLYSVPSDHAWLEINQLYLLSEANRLLDISIEDKQTKYLSTSSIKDCFIRIHLLGAAKPSNLRQQDLTQLYDTLELWSSFCVIEPGDSERSLFIINLHRDRQAQYRQNLRDDQKALFRGLNTSKLVQALKLWATSPTAQHPITVPKQLSDTLLSHAIQAWSIHWQRAFRRSAAEGDLQLCIGLSATHYYCAGQMSFERAMIAIQPKTIETNARLSKTVKQPTDGDIWSQAFDAAGTGSDGRSFTFDSINFVKPSASDNEEAKYPAHTASIVNASPGGYLVRWQGTAPTNLQAGELLGVKEHGVAHWAIGVVRWISLQGQETQLGIELLSPRAEIGAAQLLQKTGTNGAFMRALLLPAIKAIAQPATLLVPHMPFRTGNKVELQFATFNGRHQLVKRVTSTNSFNQFQFRSTGLISNAPTPASVTGLDDNFDNLWSKL